MPPETPQAIARYQIIRALGEGGMGSVYLAKDPAIDRFVAIKLLRSGFDDEAMRERFRREAKAVGQLHHINIVTIFDVGEYEGNPFIAMEYVEGQTLGQIIRSGSEIPLGNALNWMEGLCAGLHYAHKRGIVHRDIKPANLVVDDESKVKILDFGIARGPASGMTQVGMLMGTLNYMSPEQLSGKSVDHRSDIFAVGAVFYELLTGKQAFPGDINSGVLHRILMGQPDPVRQLNPTLTDDIVAMIDRCLSKDPAARYPELEAMRRDIVRARSRLESFAPEATIRMPRPPAVGVGRQGRTPGESTRAELMRQRRERIAQQLTRAREAIAARELAVAADACNQALILDPENADAFELQEKVERLEQAQQWLGEAKNEIEKGALTSASMLMDRVADLDPDLPEAAPVREKIAATRARIEEMQRRARAVREAIERGQAELAADRLDAARAAVKDAIAIEPGNEDAAALGRAIADRAAALQRAAEEQRAKEAIDQARRRFAAGEHDAAIAMLKAHAPAHPLLDDARQALEFERREIQRREAEERARLEAKRREEEEQRRREEERKRQEEEQQRREEARRREEENRKRQEEERKRQEEERKRREEERKEARRREEEERKRLAEEERRRLAEEARTLREEEERLKREAKAREEERRREDDERRQAQERAAKAERTAVEERARLEARKQQAPDDADRTVIMFQSPGGIAEPAPAPAPAPPPPAPPMPAPAPPAPLSLSGGLGSGTLDQIEGLQPAERRPVPRAAILAMIGAAVVVLGAIVWWTIGQSGGGGTGQEPASVLIDIRPWAAVESIVVKATGQAVDAPCPATPCVVSLPPGEYHVRARNPFFPNAIELDVTITGSGYQEVRRALPEFNPEEEARRILGGR